MTGYTGPFLDFGFWGGQATRFPTRVGRFSGMFYKKVPNAEHSWNSWNSWHSHAHTDAEMHKHEHKQMQTHMYA